MRMTRTKRFRRRTLVAATLAALARGTVALADPPVPAAQAAAPPPIRLSEDVVVQAVRAEERTPVTKTDVGREEIEAVSRASAARTPPAPSDVEGPSADSLT